MLTNMFYTKMLRGVFSTVLILGVMVLGLGNALSINTFAAGVAITVSPSIQTVSTAGSVTLGLTTTTVIPVNGLVQVVYPTAGYTGTPSLAIGGGTVGATITTTSGTDTIAEATVIGAVSAGAKTIVITGLTSSAVSGNNLFTVYTSAGDYGAAFQYVGNANQVTIRAIVPVALSFAIRNAADTANTNSCDMGNLSVSTVGSCSYRLKVATNAEFGYTISTVTSGNLTNGTASFPNAAVGTAGTGGTTQVAGTELYGAKINKGSVTTAGGTTTLASVYDAGTNNVLYNNTATADLVTTDKPNNPSATDTTNTTLVTHEASIAASTAAGIYTQRVMYTVTPSFAPPVGPPVQQ
jgi:hypothetical protein